MSEREDLARLIQTADMKRAPEGYAASAPDDVSDWGLFIADAVLKASQTVYVVVCIELPNKPERDVTHIFSSAEKAQAFCDADKGRGHVCYDYVLDCPERMEGVSQ